MQTLYWYELGTTLPARRHEKSTFICIRWVLYRVSPAIFVSFLLRNIQYARMDNIILLLLIGEYDLYLLLANLKPGVLFQVLRGEYQSIVLVWRVQNHNCGSSLITNNNGYTVSPWSQKAMSWIERGERMYTLNIAFCLITRCVVCALTSSNIRSSRYWRLQSVRIFLIWRVIKCADLLIINASKYDPRTKRL